MIRDCNGRIFSAPWGLMSEVHSVISTLNNYGNITRRNGKLLLIANPSVIQYIMDGSHVRNFLSQDKTFWYAEDASLKNDIIHLKEDDRIFATILDFRYI